MDKLTIEELYNMVAPGGVEFITPKLCDRLTICVLKLKNGAVVTGESIVMDMSNYNKNVGNRIAYDNAINKIWELEGYHRISLKSE